MLNAKKTLCLIVLVALPYLNACADEPRPENIILGQWARSQAECAQPELSFSQTRLAVRIDADGAPTAFEYQNIAYVQSSGEVKVQLSARHPYSKTPEKNALSFKIEDNNTISMQHLRIKNAQFIRCQTK